MRHVLTVCDDDVPAVRYSVVDSLVIRRETDGTILQLCPNCGAVFSNGDHECLQHSESRPLVERRTRTCDQCGERFREITDEP
ncbi:MAG: hypothetical protein R3C44_05555 [Chloroflexota bacterium]